MSPTNELRDKALRWEATFTDLRLAGVTLDEWLEFHRATRRKAA